MEEIVQLIFRNKFIYLLFIIILFSSILWYYYKYKNSYDVRIYNFKNNIQCTIDLNNKGTSSCWLLENKSIKAVLNDGKTFNLIMESNDPIGSTNNCLKIVSKLGGGTCFIDKGSLHIGVHNVLIPEYKAKVSIIEYN